MATASAAVVSHGMRRIPASSFFQCLCVDTPRKKKKNPEKHIREKTHSREFFFFRRQSVAHEPPRPCQFVTRRRGPFVTRPEAVRAPLRQTRRRLSSAAGQGEGGAAMIIFLGYQWSGTYRRYVRLAMGHLNESYAVLAHDANTTRTLCRLLEQHADAVVLSGFEASSKYLRQVVRASRRMLMPPLNVMTKFEGARNGKRLTSMWLQTHDMSSHSLVRYDIANRSAWRFPLMIKPIRGTNGRNVRIVNESTDGNLTTVHPKVHILEEAVPGQDEWGFYIASYDGRLLDLGCSVFHFDRPLFVRDKRSSGILGVRHPRCPDEIAVMARRLTEQSRYHGIGCGNAKIVGGVAKLFELNPRICGVMMYRKSLFAKQVALLKRATARDARLRCKPTAANATVREPPRTVASPAGVDFASVFRQTRQRQQADREWPSPRSGRWPGSRPAPNLTETTRRSGPRPRGPRTSACKS